jgi:hypothetical protein
LRFLPRDEVLQFFLYFKLRKRKPSNKSLIQLLERNKEQISEEFHTAVEADTTSKRRYTMSIALALLAPPQGSFNGVDNDQKIARVYFTVTPSGNYPALGDPMDFTALGDVIMSGQPPLFVAIQSAKSGGASGYQYSYNPGNPSTQANGKFQVLQNGAGTSPNADIGAGAYPAGVTGDTIIGYVEFPRL